MTTNLLDFDRNGLRDYVISLGEPSFRANQLLKWIHQHGICDFNLMTNLSKLFRNKLLDQAVIQAPNIVTEKISQDGTRKWLLKCLDGALFEMVYIPEPGRGTLCVSSQVGCNLGCLFCETGKHGFKRNLSTAEIIGQLWLAIQILSNNQEKTTKQVTNVVLMGMGEPLLNLDNVIFATNLMMDDLAYGLSKYRVTISTAGIVPAIDKLSKCSEASLAISLHAPNNELRNNLIPINLKYPLEELLPACKKFFADNPRRKVSIEYILLNNINDNTIHAKQLVKCLQGLRCKINLIPFNESPSINYQCSSEQSIDSFKKILLAAGFNVTTRKKRGADIQAACGQLTGLYKPDIS